MKLGILASTSLSLAITLPMLAHAGTAQPGPNSQWIGLWQAQLGGQTSVILTLGDDTGQIAGAVVFNVISREGGQTRILGHDAHVIMNPHVDGDTLHFQVIRRGDQRLLEMAFHLTADGAAKFQCQNCGDDAPMVDMVREQVRPESAHADKH
jgi:hypothetical protein